MKYTILTLEIRFEHNVVQARQRARQIAQLIGFDHHEQIRIATAVSEIARNAFQYAAGGKIEFSIRSDEKILLKQAFVIRIEDFGQGIVNLQEILDGRYTSGTGMGLGIVGARRLMDHFQIESKVDEGTRIHLWKELPKKISPIPSNQLGNIVDALIHRTPEDLLEEIQKQNQELMRMMEVVKARELDLAKANEALNNTNKELEETNRGVVALYTELDEKASDLKKANEVKTRFLSYMSHEFRTPINSIIGLSRIVLDRLDGDLTVEQEKQVGFIHRAAQDVLAMANDLLDLSKAEAGKVEINPKYFQISDVFSALKGLMRPLLTNTSVELVFEESENLPTLYTDEGKIEQILRNLISNSLKFTENGEVKVSAIDNSDGTLTFRVTDTGIGIALENHKKIFEEYSQIDSFLQRKVKGTGLGLPLVKRLTELLGGQISLESSLGQGATFFVKLPVDYSSTKISPKGALKSVKQDQIPIPFQNDFEIIIDNKCENPDPVLIIDDEETSRYILKGLLAETHCQVLEAASGKEGIDLALKENPQLIFLDFVMPGMDAFEVIEALQANSKLKQIPVVIRTSKVLSSEEITRLKKNTIAILSKGVTSRETSLQEIRQVLTHLKQKKCVGGLALRKENENAAS